MILWEKNNFFKKFEMKLLGTKFEEILIALFLHLRYK